MRKRISKILDLVNNEAKSEDRVRVLRENDNGGLREILKNSFDNTKFLLPSGQPPFKKNETDDQDTSLYMDIRRLYLFKEGGNKNLSQSRREMLFIQILEGIHPDDADMLCLMKDKKIQTRWKKVNKEVVNTAFPGLIEETVGKTDG